MADKTWTATDLKMGTLRLKRDDEDSTLFVMEGYSYVDSGGNVIEDLPQKTISVAVNYSDIPASVATCLLTIFDYVYQQALIKEGMV